MKRAITAALVTILMTMAATNLASAQETGKNCWLNNTYIHLGLGSASNLKSIDTGLSTNYVEGSLGYFVIPQAFAYIRFEGGLKLEEINSQNTFFKYQNIGGGLGWRFHKSQQYGALDWCTDFTTSCGNQDWKNNEFGTGIYWKLPSCRLGGISLGLGYKFYHSRTDGIKSRGGISATVGFSF